MRFGTELPQDLSLWCVDVMRNQSLPRTGHFEQKPKAKADQMKHLLSGRLTLAMQCLDGEFHLPGPPHVGWTVVAGHDGLGQAVGVTAFGNSQVFHGDSLISRGHVLAERRDRSKAVPQTHPELFPAGRFSGTDTVQYSHLMSRCADTQGKRRPTWGTTKVESTTYLI